MSSSAENLPVRRPPERPGPVGGKRDRNRRKRTRQLLDAALSLFLGKGVESVSIDEIVRSVGIAKGSFYNYFSNKTELVEALLAGVSQKVRNAYDRCRDAVSGAQSELELLAAYTGMGASLMQLIDSEEPIMRLYLQENRAPAVGARVPICALSQEIVQRTVELTELAVAKNLLRPVHPQVTALAVVGAVERLQHAWFDGQLEGESGSLVQELILLVLQGLQRRD